MIYLTSFTRRFTYSFIRTSIYRMAYKFGFLFKGQSVFAHALVIAIIGTIIAIIIKGVSKFIK